jgi:hypothetical protein
VTMDVDQFPNKYTYNSKELCVIFTQKVGMPSDKDSPFLRVHTMPGDHFMALSVCKCITNRRMTMADG